MNEPLLNEIKQFLFNEWDPIGLNKHPAANAEYDRYAPRIYRRLESGQAQTTSPSILASVRTD